MMVERRASSKSCYGVPLRQGLLYDVKPNPSRGPIDCDVHVYKISAGAQTNAPLRYQKVYRTLSEMVMRGGSASGTPVGRTS